MILHFFCETNYGANNQESFETVNNILAKYRLIPYNIWYIFIGNSVDLTVTFSKFRRKHAFEFSV